MTYDVLAVCTGNICRSPMVEHALRRALEDAGLAGSVRVASAGISGWEEGNPVDPRAGELLRAEGIDASAHRARMLEPTQLAAADLVLALDHDHVEPLRAAIGTDRPERLRMVRDFAPGDVGDTGIRDPWYGDEADFRSAWEQIEEAMPGLVEHVRAALDAPRPAGPGSGTSAR